VFVIPTSLTILNLFGSGDRLRDARDEATPLTQRSGERLRDCVPVALFAAVRYVRRPDRAPAQRDERVRQEYDSLADVVTFGAAPAVLVYAGLYVPRSSAAASRSVPRRRSLRLARFNVMTGRPTTATSSDYRARRRTDDRIHDLYAPAPVTDRSFAFIVHRDRQRRSYDLADPLPQLERTGAAEERSLIYFLISPRFSRSRSWPREFCSMARRVSRLGRACSCGPSPS
jgi:hypothetical protein